MKLRNKRERGLKSSAPETFIYKLKKKNEKACAIITNK